MELPLNWVWSSSSSSSHSDSWLGANFVSEEPASDWESQRKAGPAATDGRPAGSITADEVGCEDDGPATGPATADEDGREDDKAATGPGVCSARAEAEGVVVGL